MPSELKQHLVMHAPNASLEARLLRKYHRVLAERLWSAYTSQDFQEHPVERKPTLWLHPRACWAARLVDLAPDLFLKVRDLAWIDLNRSTSLPPSLEILTGDYDDPWCATARTYLEDYDRMLGKCYSISMSDLEEQQVRDRIDESSDVIASFWPEAFAEQQLILRTLVVVQGGGYMYGSFQNMLGSIFVAQDSLRSVESTVEMLLHEVSHQTLFVHAAYQEYVENGDVLVHHPLRADPRPIAGTVHAAHVLGRLAIGFSKWCDTCDVTAPTQARRKELLEMCEVTLSTLRNKARWTPEGEQYFEHLVTETAPYLSPARG